MGGVKITFHGKCNICRNCRINIDGGSIEFGDNFWANAGLIISAHKSVKFGKNCLLGWDCFISDGDGHSIVDCNSNLISNYGKPVCVGEHVWIAANVALLKGTKISDDSVIAYGSSISKTFDKSNVLIGGTPGKILKTDITWTYKTPI